jgi:hypothetical protein
MPIATKRDEWEQVWSVYDHGAVLPVPPPEAVAAVRKPVLRPALRKALAGCGVLLLIGLLIGMLALPKAGIGSAGRAAALASLAPDEGMLPPLSVAIARLAAQSPEAACWALRLHPQGSGCAEAPRGP